MKALFLSQKRYSISIQVIALNHVIGGEIKKEPSGQGSGITMNFIQNFRCIIFDEKSGYKSNVFS